MRYLTRQVAVEAIQWDGKADTFVKIRDMIGDEYDLDLMDPVEGILQLDTSTGSAWPMKGEDAHNGDWIVWDGEYAHAYKHSQFWEFFRLEDGPEIEVRPTPKTQEEKIAFREQWDERVARGMQS